MNDNPSGPEQGPDGRRERRQRVLKGGRIVFNRGYSAFDCRVKNISSTGAMLEMETNLGIPSHFDLIIGPSDPPRHCRVVWRTDKRMGVTFEDPPAG